MASEKGKGASRLYSSGAGTTTTDTMSYHPQTTITAAGAPLFHGIIHYYDHYELYTLNEGGDLSLSLILFVHTLTGSTSWRVLSRP